MDENETLGRYLKQHRESQNISLKEVAKHTRIREPFLRAIEEDRYDQLPSSTYAKGFLLTYAKYFKLDSHDILLRYERTLKGQSLSLPPTHSQEPRQKYFWRAKKTWTIAGIIVACFFFYFFFLYPRESTVEPAPDKPVSQKTSIEEKLPLVPPPPSSLQTATSPVVSVKAISLQIKTLEAVWVTLQVDDQPEKEMSFKPGENISVQASQRVNMRVGNLGGLKLTLNGKPLEKLGKPGEVAILMITPQGVVVKPPEKAGSP